MAWDYFPTNDSTINLMIRNTNARGLQIQKMTTTQLKKAQNSLPSTTLR